MKKSNAIVACLCAVTLATVSFSSGYAAGNNATYKSQGVLRFDNDTADTSDDVIFNANDFSSIDAVVTSGKVNVANALNEHVDSGIATTVIPTFNALVDAINNIPNNGTLNQTLSVNREYINIPRGYHNGAGRISIDLESKTLMPGVNTQVVEPSEGKVLSFVTVQGSSNLKAENIKSGIKIFDTVGSYTDDATVDEDKILASYTAYAKGSKLTGKIPSLDAKTWMPGTTDQTIDAGSYLSGDQTIVGDANLVPANIVNGKSIFGVNGTAVLEKNASAHNVPTGKTVAGAGDTLTGKTFWNGSSWQNGSMPNKANTTVAATTVSESGSNALITVPVSGYYDTDSKLQVPVETIKKQVSALNSSYAPNSNPVIYKQAAGVAGNPTTTFSITITEKGNYYISGSCGGRGGINDYYIAKNGSRLSLTEDCKTYTYGGVYTKLYHVSNIIECSIGDIITYSATQSMASSDCIVLDFIYVIKV